MKDKVVLGLSGGVDSAFSAYLLKSQGYEVIGATFIQCDKAEREISGAKSLAKELNIEHRVVDAREDFRNLIEKNFSESYLKGLTPNPCVLCNRLVKFKTLIKLADSVGAEYVATGHYAKIVNKNGAYFVAKGDDAKKDQSYMLYQLGQDTLSRIIFPLGEFTKEEVREKAKNINLSVAKKSDSEDICFIPSNDYTAYLTEHNENLTPKGNFVDTAGNILGEHEGIYRYTIGQRKGLNIAVGRPVYVKKIDAEKNEVILTDNENLFESKITATDLFFANGAPKDDEEFAAKVKTRYHHSGTTARLKKIGNTIEINFEEPVRAPAPGQSAVFYEEERVIGGGIIL